MGDVLVVGATGKVGSILVDTLAKANVPVRAATRKPETAGFPAGVKGVKLDLFDPATFGPALDGVDKLFVMIPPGLPPGTLETFIDFAVPKVHRVVTMTTAGAEYDEKNPGRLIEKRIEAGAKEWTHIRPGFFMQNFNAFHIHTIKATGNVRLPLAESRTAFIDARDIADCVAAALTKDGLTGKAFTVTGPEAITYAEAAAILSRETGASIGFQNIDDATYIQETVAAGMSPQYAGFMTTLYANVRNGSASRVRDGVQQVTGKAPRSFADYARTFKHYFV